MSDFAYGDDDGRADPAIRRGEGYFPPLADWERELLKSAPDSGQGETCAQQYLDGTTSGCTCGHIIPDGVTKDASTQAFWSKPDDTFEQYQRELRHTQAIEDRAAKRGRDEALAVVVKALMHQAEKAAGDRSLIQTRTELAYIANFIERKQGGDGP